MDLLHKLYLYRIQTGHLTGCMDVGPLNSLRNVCSGCSDGAVVRALASHHYGLGSIPRSGVICGLSLLALYSAPRFCPGTPVSLLLKNQHFT